MSKKSYQQALADDTISKLKGVDNMLERQINPKYVVPVVSGRNPPYGPGYYEDKQILPIEDKVHYAPALLGESGNDPEITTEITNEDVKKMKNKAYIATLRDFDRWVVEYMEGLGLDQPQKKEWLRNVYPEFFERQVEAMKMLHDAQAKYEKLCVEGARTIEDMYFMYMFEKENLMDHSTQDGSAQNELGGLYDGRVDIDMDTIGNVAFERGIWNTRKRLVSMLTQWGIVSGHPNKDGKYEQDKYYLGPNFSEKDRIASASYPIPKRSISMRNKEGAVTTKENLAAGPYTLSARPLIVSSVTGKSHIHGFDRSFYRKPKSGPETVSPKHEAPKDSAGLMTE